MTEKQAVQEHSDAPADLRLLDDLIRRCYEELISDKKDKLRLGDFLKMIELRRKLTPDDASQSALWKRLEKVRQDVLGPKGKQSKKGSQPRNSARKNGD